VYAVDDLPVAYLDHPKLRAVLIADIHLGFEEYMATKGVFLPRYQLKRATEIVDHVASSVNVDTLVIVGDIKHLFDKLGRRESKDLAEFVTYIKKRFSRVVLVRGNHDNFVYSFSQRYGVEFYESLAVDDVLIVHGHKEADLSGYKLVIMGHEHPSIAIKDPVTEVVSKLPCFLKIPLRVNQELATTAVVLPAAGAYQAGTAVSTSPESFLSPIIRKYAVLEEAIPYAIVEKESVYELPPLKDIERLLAML
jgi:hypothetical protein